MSISRIDEAFTLMADGASEEAAQVLEGVLDVAPGYAPAYVLYARACEDLHVWPQALNLWQAALLLVPSLAVARDGVLRATRVIAALKDLDQQLTPDDAASEPETSPTGHSSSDPAPAVRPVPLGKSAIGEPPPPPPARPSATQPPFPDADVGLEDSTPVLPEVAPAEGSAPSPDDAAFSAPPPPPGVIGATPMPATEEVPPMRPFDLDLDGLIEQLNTQSRITPRPDLDHIPAPDLEDDGEDMVSETLARIYATQGQYDEAARIYELLAAQQPHKAEAFQREARTLRGRAGDE